jgi:hypothetical protein
MAGEADGLPGGTVIWAHEDTRKSARAKRPKNFILFITILLHC